MNANELCSELKNKVSSVVDTVSSPSWAKRRACAAATAAVAIFNEVAPNNALCNTVRSVASIAWMFSMLGALDEASSDQSHRREERTF